MVKEDVKKIQRGELVPLVVYMPREMHAQISDVAHNLSKKSKGRITMSQIVRASIAQAVNTGLDPHVLDEQAGGGR